LRAKVCNEDKSPVPQNYIPALENYVILILFLIDGTGETLLTAVGTVWLNNQGLRPWGFGRKVRAIPPRGNRCEGSLAKTHWGRETRTPLVRVSCTALMSCCAPDGQLPFSPARKFTARRDIEVRLFK